MARHGKSEACLLSAEAFQTDHQQGAGIEDSGQRAQPGLVIVLRAVIAEHGVGNVTLKEVGGPALPVAEKDIDDWLIKTVGTTREKFRGGWGRAGAGIEKRDLALPARKTVVNNGEVPNHQGEEAET